MNFFSRFSIDGRATFERFVTRLTLLGALLGLCAFFFIRSNGVDGPAVLGSVAVVALVAASSLRGRDDTQPLGLRVLGLGLGLSIGFALGSPSGTVIALGACCGLALVADADAGVGRRLLAALGGGLGAAWGLWLVPQFDRLFGVAPLLLRSVGGSAVGALALGLGLLLSHLRLHRDRLSAELEALNTEAGKRLARTFERCHLGLSTAPAAMRRGVLATVGSSVREATRLIHTLENFDRRLAAANPNDARAQLAELKKDLEGTADALSRQRLQAACGSLSDSLEQLETLERKREQLGAELKLKLATLERIALALETAHGEPALLQSAMLRLAPVGE